MVTVYINRWGIKSPRNFRFFQKTAVFLTSYPFITLLFTDASSIIKFIEEIHAQHVDLTPDNPHVLRYTGRLFSWGNNLQEKIRQFIRFAGKKPVLPDQKPAKK